MSLRTVYIRIEASEYEVLRQYAAEERRLTNEQAAHIVSQALRKWRMEKAFEASLPSPADEPTLEGVA